MTATPTITSERLVLRPFSEEHLTERYVAWLNDPEVVRFSELRHRAHSMEDCVRHLAALRESDHMFWAIELRAAPHTHIGNASAYFDLPNRVAEVSILLGDRAMRGKALGSEAWCTVVDYLATSDDVRMVEAGTMSTNTAMLKLFERSGMEITGRQPGRFLLDGCPVDLVTARRLADGVRP